MDAEPTADWKRVHANLEHRLGPVSPDEVASWTPEQLARAESWLAARRGIALLAVPDFVASAARAARHAAARAGEAELAAACRGLIAADRTRRAARQARRAAVERLFGAIPTGADPSTPIVCDGHVIALHEGEFVVRRARRVGE